MCYACSHVLCHTDAVTALGVPRLAALTSDPRHNRLLPVQREHEPCDADAVMALDSPHLAAIGRPVPHAWLLPRCAAVLHAGGAGTVAAVLLAGIPQVVCPLHFDQPAWVRQRITFV